MLLLGNPCEDSNIKELSAGDRSVSYQADTDKCDATDSEINSEWQHWYRVTGNAGNALRVNAPASESCGAEANVYLREHHPYPSEGVVSKQACVRTPSDTCKREIEINVINCGPFYLYQLLELRPSCNQKTWRYCTNARGK